MDNQVKNQTRRLISKGKTKNAIDLLLQELKANNDVILISNMFNELERKIIAHVISNDEANIERNKINDSILRFLDAEDETNQSTLILDSRRLSLRFKNHLPKMIFGIFVIIAILLFFVFQFNHETRSNDGSMNAILEPVEVGYDELPSNFKIFYEKFMTNVDFQMSHISFPINGIYPDSIQKNKSIATNSNLIFKKDWKVLTNNDENVSKQKFKNDKDKIIYQRIEDKEQKVSSSRIFIEFDDIWLLVSFYETQEITFDTRITEDFLKFYHQFHRDSIFQMNHILFPLHGIPTFTKKGVFENEDYRWNKNDWQLHLPIDEDSDFSKFWLRSNNLKMEDGSEVSLLIESILNEGASYGIQRRFMKIDDKWYLVYYSGMNELM